MSESRDGHSADHVVRVASLMGAARMPFIAQSQKCSVPWWGHPYKLDRVGGVRLVIYTKVRKNFTEG